MFVVSMFLATPCSKSPAAPQASQSPSEQRGMHWEERDKDLPIHRAVLSAPYRVVQLHSRGKAKGKIPGVAAVSSDG